MEYSSAPPLPLSKPEPEFFSEFLAAFSEAIFQTAARLPIQMSFPFLDE
jgi:hypothetical protein